MARQKLCKDKSATVRSVQHMRVLTPGVMIYWEEQSCLSKDLPPHFKKLSTFFTVDLLLLALVMVLNWVKSPWSINQSSSVVSCSPYNSDTLSLFLASGKQYHQTKLCFSYKSISLQLIRPMLFYDDAGAFGSHHTSCRGVNQQGQSLQCTENKQGGNPTVPQLHSEQQDLPSLDQSIRPWITCTTSLSRCYTGEYHSRNVDTAPSFNGENSFWHKHLSGHGEALIVQCQQDRGNKLICNFKLCQEPHLVHDQPCPLIGTTSRNNQVKHWVCCANNHWVVDGAKFRE